MKPKILIIENSKEITGAFNAVLRSCIFLREEYSFYFVIPQKSQIRNQLEQNGFESFDFPMIEIRKSIADILLYFPVLLINGIRFFKLTKDLNIDLIHSNDFYNLIPACYRFLGGRINYVCHVRFLPDRFPKLLRSLLFSAHLRYAETIIGVSRAVTKQLPNSLKVICIYDGLPEKDLYEFEKPGTKTLLYVSNYIPGKGQQYAIDAFAKVARKYSGWKLMFFGGDMGLKKNKKFKEELYNKVKDGGLVNCVVFNDFKNNLRELYRDSTIVLNFSDSESFSLTCLEAQYYGRPVIATRSGGPEEIIVDSLTGFLVERRSLEQITKALEFLIADPVSAMKMGAKGFENVRKKFSTQNTYTKLSNTYAQAINAN